MRILTGVVTYNRKALLKRCVDHIRAQTRPTDLLLVINNSSTDGTIEMLDEEGVAYLTQPNLGSAGGWARAISEADARGFDAVWLMDDDGFPDPGALAALESALTPGVGCVSSVVLRENQRTHFVFPFPRLNRGGYPALLGRRRKITTLTELRKEAEGELYPFAHLFNGALVSVATAREIGNVSPDYFMSGDEVDYFMRLQRHAPIYSHLNAWHYHPDVTTRPLTPEKLYYYVKNTIILNKLYFDKKPARHFMAVAAALVRTASRNSFGTMMSYVAGRHAPVLWRAVGRGLRSRMGKDFSA